MNKSIQNLPTQTRNISEQLKATNNKKIYRHKLEQFEQGKRIEWS